MMSSVLKWSDTTIIIIAVIGAISGQFVTALTTQMWVLYIAYVLFMLWNTITTISRYQGFGASIQYSLIVNSTILGPVSPSSWCQQKWEKCSLY